MADAGGTVMARPFDGMDAGRMAVIVGPAGAMFSVLTLAATGDS